MDQTVRCETVAAVVAALTLVSSACGSARSSSPTAPGVRSTSPRREPSFVGVWEGNGLAQILPGAASQSIQLELYERRPSSLDELPLCVAYDVPASAAAFDCLVPLRRCTLRVELNRRSEALVIEARPEREAGQCGRMPARRAMRLRRLTENQVFEIGAEIFARSVAPRLGDTFAGVEQTLGASLTEIGRAVARVVLPSGSLPSNWQWATDIVRVAIYRLKEACQSTPGSRCFEQHLSAVVAQLVEPDSEATDEAPSLAADAVHESVAETTVFWTGDGGLPGVWVGEHGAETGLVQIGEQFIGVSRDPTPLSTYQDEFGCLARGDPRLGTELPCEGSEDSRILLEPRGDRLLVRLLGMGWLQGPYRPSRFYLLVRKTDPFQAIVPSYVEMAQGSRRRDFMGRHPHQAISGLARRARAAVARMDDRPQDLVLGEVEVLLNHMFVTLTDSCQGLPDADYQGTPPQGTGLTCSEAEVTDLLNLVMGGSAAPFHSGMPACDAYVDLACHCDDLSNRASLCHAARRTVRAFQAHAQSPVERQRRIQVCMAEEQSLRPQCLPPP